MKNPTDIEFITGPVEVGWTDFTIRLREHSWSCNASYLWSHPLNELILSAVAIWNHIYNEPYTIENAVWYSNALDEPGGIMIQAIPQNEDVEVSVFQYRDDIVIDLDKKPDFPPAGVLLVNYWDYAKAVFTDASRTIARHGFTGFHQEWNLPHSLEERSHIAAIPIGQFLYLAQLVMKNKKDNFGLSLNDEIELLQKIQTEY